MRSFANFKSTQRKQIDDKQTVSDFENVLKMYKKTLETSALSLAFVKSKGFSIEALTSGAIFEHFSSAAYKNATK